MFANEANKLMITCFFKKTKNWILITRTTQNSQFWVVHSYLLAKKLRKRTVEDGSHFTIWGVRPIFFDTWKSVCGCRVAKVYGSSGIIFRKTMKWVFALFRMINCVWQRSPVIFWLDFNQMHQMQNMLYIWFSRWFGWLFEVHW